MTAIGIVRKTDELGRLVIPIEIRRSMGLEPGVTLEILVDGDTILLRPADT